MIEFWNVSAFVTPVLKGNPAFVTLLDCYPDSSIMQAYAKMLGASETTFLTKTEDPNTFFIRWFSPRDEAPLCGHATMAAAHYLHKTKGLKNVTFRSKYYELSTSIDDDGLVVLDFPKMPLCPSKLSLPSLFNQENVLDVLEDDKLLVVVLNSHQLVKDFVPCLETIKTIPKRALVITARGPKDIDFVSRYFAPSVGIDEDPVCGSSHCRTGLYWGEKLGKTSLVAHQYSKEGGELKLTILKDRLMIKGQVLHTDTCHLEDLSRSAA